MQERSITSSQQSLKMNNKTIEGGTMDVKVEPEKKKKLKKALMLYSILLVFYMLNFLIESERNCIRTLVFITGNIFIVTLAFPVLGRPKGASRYLFYWLLLLIIFFIIELLYNNCIEI